MAKGLSIHIGLNWVDPSRYPSDWDSKLSGCVNDAKAMQSIAKSLGYTSVLLLNEQATSSQVLKLLGQAAQKLVSGDILLLTYSGHGGQVPDVNGDEEDMLDETWVLYDRELIDDELYAMWSQFKAGVRIFMLSDSCHSGTIAKVLAYKQLSMAAPVAKKYRVVGNKPPAFRLMPFDVQKATYQQNTNMYDTLQWKAVKGNKASIGASVILISGCMDIQLSADGTQNGLFTENLLKVWNGGAFVGNYLKFRKDITKLMPQTQTPNYFTVGSVNANFENQKPFTINVQTTGTVGTQGTATGHEGTHPSEYQPVDEQESTSWSSDEPEQPDEQESTSWSSDEPEQPDEQETTDWSSDEQDQPDEQETTEWESWPDTSNEPTGEEYESGSDTSNEPTEGEPEYGLDTSYEPTGEDWPTDSSTEERRIPRSTNKPTSKISRKKAKV